MTMIESMMLTLWLLVLTILLGAWRILAVRARKRRRDHYKTDALWWDTFQKRIKEQEPL